jgi:hypothetical protein
MPKVTHLEPPFARRLETFSKELKKVGKGDVGCRQLHALYMRERTSLIAVTSRLVSGASESEPVAERAVS